MKIEIFSAWRYIMSLWYHIFRMAYSTMCSVLHMCYPKAKRKNFTTTSIKRLTYSVGCGNDINSKCRLQENLLLFFLVCCCGSLIKLNSMRLIVSHCITSEWGKGNREVNRIARIQKKREKKEWTIHMLSSIPPTGLLNHMCVCARAPIIGNKNCFTRTNAQ